jgi:hypothetical protein
MRSPSQYVDRRHYGLAATRTEHIGSAALKLCFPRGKYVELLGKLPVSDRP